MDVDRFYLHFRIKIASYFPFFSCLIKNVNKFLFTNHNLFLSLHSNFRILIFLKTRFYLTICIIATLFFPFIIHTLKKDHIFQLIYNIKYHICLRPFLYNFYCFFYLSLSAYILLQAYIWWLDTFSWWENACGQSCIRSWCQ